MYLTQGLFSWNVYSECIDKAEFIIEAPGNCDTIFFTIPNMFNGNCSSFMYFTLPLYVTKIRVIFKSFVTYIVRYVYIQELLKDL